jgi:hypothetical protein
MRNEGFAKLLTPSHNYAVVQLPGRRFPGVVFQGDSLNSLVRKLDSARQHLAASRMEEALGELDYIFEELCEIQSDYEKALVANSIRLPYPKQDTA